jgi:shikimate dehydrogenase
VISSQTRLYWLLGHPVKQTISPSLFNPAFAAAQHDAALMAIDTPPQQLEGAISLFRHASNAQGCLLTIPHKQQVVKYMDALSLTSQALGIVNIIRKTPQGLEGDALDGWGFTGALAHHGHSVREQRVLVIGCGGAGAASAWQTLSQGAARVGLLDVDQSRSAGLAQMLARQFGPHRVLALNQLQGDWSIVLNTSPLGMRPGDALPMPLQDISPTALLVDATTPAQPSRWLTQASERGHRVIHGSDFTRGQALAMAAFWSLPKSVCEALAKQ